MKTIKWIVGLSLVGISSFACSSDSAESTSGVEGSIVLSELGPTEAQDICSWYVDLMSDSAFVESLCQAFAVEVSYSNEADVSSDAAIQTNCSNAKAMCLSKMQTKLIDVQKECVTALDAMTCSATVSDFETCARAQSKLTYDNLPACGDLTVARALPVGDWRPAQPAACNALYSKCSDARI
jgi:hypothetical protein